MNRGFAAVVAVVCAAGVLAPVGATALPTKAVGGSTQAGLKQSDLTVPGGAVGDNLGDSVAVSGNTVVAGAYDRTVGTHSKQGAVYVFARPTTGWRSVTPTATLTAGDGQAGDLFGYSVAISGRTIVVGSVAHAVGSTLYQGTVYVFTEPTTGWKTTSHPTAELTVSDGVSGDELGSAVAISGDTIVAGAPREGPSFNGEAYLFTKPASGWKTKTQTARLTISAGSNPDDFFGGEVAVSGNTVVVSDYGRYNRAGRAYLYLKPASGPWIDTAETSILNGSDTANYEFGAGIAVAGDTVVVVSPRRRSLVTPRLARSSCSSSLLLDGV